MPDTQKPRYGLLYRGRLLNVIPSNRRYNYRLSTLGGGPPWITEDLSVAMLVMSQGDTLDTIGTPAIPMHFKHPQSLTVVEVAEDNTVVREVPVEGLPAVGYEDYLAHLTSIGEVDAPGVLREVYMELPPEEQAQCFVFRRNLASATREHLTRRSETNATVA